MNLRISCPRKARVALFAHLLLSLIMGTGIARAEDITGDLNVSGILDVHGNTFSLSSWTGDDTRFGLATIYTEDTSHAATSKFLANRPVSNWWWQETTSNGTGTVLQMSLSSNNALTLYDKATSQSPAIILDPINGSTFATSVTFNGNANKMLNQTVDNPANVLTVGLADARYLVHSSGNTLTIGTNASASGDAAVALGYNANASGSAATSLGTNSAATGGGSTALGVNVAASGYQAIAIGDSTSSNGNYSTAMGVLANAGGWYSVAIGTNSSAAGYQSTAVGALAKASDYSQAFGEEANATGQQSVALGRYVHASGLYSVALGLFSTASGIGSAALGTNSQSSNWESTAVGMQSAASGSGAMALGLNSAASGNCSVSLGSFASASGDYATALTSSSAASGDYGVSAGVTNASSLYVCTVGAYGSIGGNPHQWVDTDELFVIGNGQAVDEPSNAFVVKKNGDTEVQGNLKVGKALIVLPQGDLQMGEFVAQPSPSPTP